MSACGAAQPLLTVRPVHCPHRPAAPWAACDLVSAALWWTQAGGTDGQIKKEVHRVRLEESVKHLFVKRLFSLYYTKTTNSVFLPKYFHMLLLVF